MRPWVMTIIVGVALCLGWHLPARATVEREVTSFDDGLIEGTLRVILHHACDADDDDIIRFAPTHLDKIRIPLESPLVIPQDCNGSVTLIGATAVETILDAAAFAPQGRRPGDLCILHIYSDRHQVTNISFVGNATGAGVCLFGRSNRVAENRFGREKSGHQNPNRYGIVVADAFARRFPGMDGADNILDENTIGPEMEHGIWITAARTVVTNNTVALSGSDGLVVRGEEHQLLDNLVIGNGGHGIRLGGKGSRLERNTIATNGGCPGPNEVLDSDPVSCLAQGTGKGAGCFVEADASSLTIGGFSFPEHGNMIQFNMGGGVVLDAAATIDQIQITHNRIARNYGGGIGIDLNADGASMNDVGDLDAGPNTLFNAVEHFQVVPLPPTSGSLPRYWSWGVAFDAARAELFTVHPEDTERPIFFGGGDTWLHDVFMTDDTFALPPEAAEFGPGDVVTTLTFDDLGNTSEFGLNTRVGADTDTDGIIDPHETGAVNGNGSSSTLADTDGDGLPDPIEDHNRNGVWDKDRGETATFLADSDGDGLSDWIETHGDGRYLPGVDTNPLAADTDGDTLTDGLEDANSNGVWEGYLMESSPLHVDSDTDGILDTSDTCPAIPNPGQDPWYCTF